MRTVETTVYQFSELEESAKENARDYVRQHWIFQDSNDWDFIFQDAAAAGEILGISIDYRTWTNSHGFSGKEEKIFFDLYRRTCSVCADYRYNKGAAKKIKDYAPVDGELARIAAGLQEIQKRNFYQLRATMAAGGLSDDYQNVDVYRYDEKEFGRNTENELTELLTDFSWWILRQLERQYEYSNSAESIDEMLIANEYEFTENGELAK